MSKTLNEYITARDYANKTLLVLSGGSSGVSLCLFNTVIITRITSAGISLVFLISNGIFKMLLKTMGRKKNNHRKIA